MSKRQFTIAIDAMGGDNSPYKVLKGTELFLKTNIKFVKGIQVIYMI